MDKNNIPLCIKRAICRKQLAKLDGVSEDTRMVFKILKETGKLGSDELPFIIYQAETLNVMGHSKRAMQLLDQAIVKNPKNSILIAARKNLDIFAAVH